MKHAEVPSGQFTSVGSKLMIGMQQRSRWRIDDIIHPRVEAELRLPAAEICILHYAIDRAQEIVECPEDDVLHLSLSGASPRGNVIFRPADRRTQEPATVGEMYFFPRGEPICARLEGDHPSSIACRFKTDALFAWLDGETNWTRHHLNANLNIVNADLRGCLWRIGRELRNPGFASQTICELLVAQAAIDLGRHCNAHRDCKTSGGLSPRRLKIVEERLSTSTRHATLGELAELCGLSVRHLARAFKISRGCSIGEYVEQRRIGHARRLLSQGRSVKEVARVLGFSSPENFSTAFRRATGQSPRQFRSCHAGGG